MGPPGDDVAATLSEPAYRLLLAERAADPQHAHAHAGDVSATGGSDSGAPESGRPGSGAAAAGGDGAEGGEDEEEGAPLARTNYATAQSFDLVSAEGEGCTGKSKGLWGWVPHRGISELPHELIVLPMATPSPPPHSLHPPLPSAGTTQIFACSRSP